MNRYVIEGIILDVLAGKQVGMVASRRQDARQMFKVLRDSDVEWDMARSSKGSESLRAGGGSLCVVTADGRGPRGLTLDVAVILDGLRPIEDTSRYRAFMECIRLTGVTRPAGVELVFCE